MNKFQTIFGKKNERYSIFNYFSVKNNLSDKRVMLHDFASLHDPHDRALHVIFSILGHLKIRKLIFILVNKYKITVLATASVSFSVAFDIWGPGRRNLSRLLVIDRFRETGQFAALMSPSENFKNRSFCILVHN